MHTYMYTVHVLVTCSDLKHCFTMASSRMRSLLLVQFIFAILTMNHRRIVREYDRRKTLYFALVRRVRMRQILWKENWERQSRLRLWRYIEQCSRIMLRAFRAIDKGSNINHHLRVFKPDVVTDRPFRHRTRRSIFGSTKKGLRRPPLTDGLRRPNIDLFGC